MLRRHRLLVSFLVAIIAVSVRPAVGEIILDQENVVLPDVSHLSYFLDYPGDYMAQSFTLNHSGELVGVGIQVSLLTDAFGSSEPPIDDLHLKILRTGQDGFPIFSEVLAQATITASALPVASPFQPGPITDVDLASWHVHVSAGDRLAIALTSEQSYNSGSRNGTNYDWWWTLYNPHAGGEFSIYSPKVYGPTPHRDLWLGDGDHTVDAGFRAFVSVVPEPRSIITTALGSILILGVVRRRMH
jgi:hypothetical protein